MRLKTRKSQTGNGSQWCWLPNTGRTARLFASYLHELVANLSETQLLAAVETPTKQAHLSRVSATRSRPRSTQTWPYNPVAQPDRRSEADNRPTSTTKPDPARGACLGRPSCACLQQCHHNRSAPRRESTESDAFCRRIQTPSLCGAANVNDRMQRLAFATCSATVADRDHMIIPMPTDLPACSRSIGILETRFGAHVLQHEGVRSCKSWSVTREHAQLTILFLN